MTTEGASTFIKLFYDLVKPKNEFIYYSPSNLMAIYTSM